MLLQHRVANPADVDLYFAWANDPDTRRQSFRSEPIPLETHQAWFARQLTDPDALLLVFETADQQPVGQVRFARYPTGQVVIGLSVDAGFRSQGLAARLIDIACVACADRWGLVTVLAYIRPENLASVRAFGRAGFGNPHQSEVAGVSCLLLTRTL